MKPQYVISEGAGIVVADASWPASLGQMGLGAGVNPASWNVQYPDRVRDVARAFVEAGSSIVVANTQQAKRGRVSPALRDEDLREWILSGVRLAREVAAGRAAVFGGVGPTGKSLSAREGTVKWFRECFEFQVGALLEAGVEAILIEGMADLSEARLAVEVAKAQGATVIASMVFDSGRYRDQTLFGTTVEQAGIGLSLSGADAVGVSGGWGLSGLDLLARRLRKVSRLPVWVRIQPQVPSSSLSPLAPDKQSVPEGEELERGLEALQEAGVGFVGGGAGMGASVVRSLHEAAQKLVSLGAGADRPDASLVAA